MTDAPRKPKPNNRNRRPQNRGPRKPRTIGTNVGAAIRDAQARHDAEKGKKAAEAMRRMIGAAK